MKANLCFSILIVALSIVSIQAFAGQYEPNTTDKLDTYALMAGSQPSGSVTVHAVVGDEPMFAPVEITFRLQCKRGFSARNVKKVVTWQTYDYGSATKGNLLSSFDTQKQEVTVYFRNAKVDATQTVVPNQYKTSVFNVKDACVRE